MLKQTNLQFKLSQRKLSPQQIQLMKLIQLPTQGIEQRLKTKELEENPCFGNERKKVKRTGWNFDVYTTMKTG